MKYFSMFTGIGGFELGIEQAYSRVERDRQEDNSLSGRQEVVNGSGVGNQQAQRPSDELDQRQATCVGYSEIDKYAIKTYEEHYGENSGMARKRECDCSTQGRQETLDSERGSLSQVNRDMHHDSDCSYTKGNTNGGHKNYGDATKINPTDLPDFELLVGGFPCQAFSVAGKRHGFNDTRGTLFFDIARILSEKRPRHLVLENVKGLLSHDSGKTFQTIIGVLTDLGYFVEWQVLNSKDFGVPQNRERVFIVGHLGGEPRRKVFPIRQSQNRNTQEIQRTIIRGRDKNTVGCLDTRGVNAFDRADLDKLIYEQRIRRLTPVECERLQGFPDNWTVGSDTQRYKQCGNAVTVNVVEAVMSKFNDKYKED